jgi:hypothetical protein
MGHVLKTAWCLGRLYELHPDSAYLGAAERLVDIVLLKGYDHQNGGPYKDYSRVTGQMLMWGQKDTAKAWWQMEQAVNAGLILYDITRKAKYLEMADETLNFFMMYFVDHTYGEVYENRTKYGGQIWDTNKGSSGKAAYHSTELGYYVYLYGRLLLKRLPATLHYAFSPVGHARDIKLTPIGITDPPLFIAGVKLNGAPYLAFGVEDRILHIPASIGGDFAVTFQTGMIESAGDRVAEVPDQMQLEQNFPNPFNPSTTIGYTIEGTGHEALGTRRVNVSVYDVLGREVAVLVNEEKGSGTYAAEFDAQGLASGVYLYRLTISGNGTHRVDTKKMILLR